MIAHDPLEPRLAHSLLGEYELLKKLGQGGMADVYLAYRPGPAGCGKLSVVKKLRPHLAGKSNWRQMLLDEAKVAGLLNHPNIVQTYEVAEFDETFFIIMEYLEGLSFGQVLRHFRHRRQLIPIEIVCYVMAEVLEGLYYAHERLGFDGEPLRIVHRDISPQNLFVTYAGLPKLLDFGVAKASILAKETDHRLLKGKLAYLAPEQARQRNVDHRADLWSAGVVLWEALAGRRLFRGPSKVETLKRSLSAVVPPIRKHNPLVPLELDELCFSALSRDVTKRLDSAWEFSQELRRFARMEGRQVRREDVASFMDLHFADHKRQRVEDLYQLLSAVSETTPPAPLDHPRITDIYATPSSCNTALDTVLEGSGAPWFDEPLSVSVRWTTDASPSASPALAAPGTEPHQEHRSPAPLSTGARTALLFLLPMLFTMTTVLLILYFGVVSFESATQPVPPPAVSRQAATSDSPATTLPPGPDGTNGQTSKPESTGPPADPLHRNGFLSRRAGNQG
jgi:serine/threonine-protein kinase